MATQEQMREYRKRWAEKNPEKVRAAQRAYYERNKEKIIERNRQRRLKDPAAYNAYMRNWCKNNPLKKRAAQQKRRAKSIPGATYTTAQMMKDRASMYGFKCRYCGAPYQTLDHRIPLSRGGTHWPANLVPACNPCNQGKRAKTEREYLLGRS